MPFESFDVMKNTIKKIVGKKFDEILEPEEIEKVFLSLGFEKVSPQLIHRLRILSEAPEGQVSHFQDAKDIAEIIDDILPQEMTKKEVNDVRFACLVHDIGKSGPAEIDSCDLPENEKQAMQQAFVDFFNLRLKSENYSGQDPRMMPVMEVLTKELGVNKAQEIWTQIKKASALQQRSRPATTFDENSVMYDVFGAHVYWTYDILKAQKIAEEIVLVASSHHILEGRNPAGIDLDHISPSIASLEMVDKYQAFRMRKIFIEEIVDKYQAFRVRRALTHEQAITVLREMVSRKLSERPVIRDMYLEIVDLLEQKQVMLEKELDIVN